MSRREEEPPAAAWSRAFAAPRRPAQFRAFSPARSEVASMLALAHRIASYVGEERAARRQPIFDLSLPDMAPPNRNATQVRTIHTHLLYTSFVHTFVHICTHLYNEKRTNGFTNRFTNDFHE